MSKLSLLLAIALLLAGAMAVAWLVARQPGRSGWTDVFWSFAIGAAGILVSLAPRHGYPDTSAPAQIAPRQIMVAILVAIWALRLGLHIAARTRHHGEDPRYA